MLFYYLSRYCRKINALKARTLVNTRALSTKRNNVILRKSGLIINGSPYITAPFFFEFGNITIDDNVYINSGCVFLDNEHIRIGKDSLIGPNVTLATVTHPISPASRNDAVIKKPIILGKNVWLGAGVVVLPGVSIGDNSVIAANSVVNRDVPPNCLYAGSPAVFKRNL
uniref:Acyltransferase n=1 Tax=Erwinia amylovora TaxID=552 RepID=A0A0P0ZH30_ERWAM|nr:sugar O-acetyltransferase [Erwinia amylovora]CDM08097.1 acyltransferase [Erwinia amylovora]